MGGFGARGECIIFVRYLTHQVLILVYPLVLVDVCT